MDSSTASPEGTTQKGGIESLSKDEIIQKYKGLLALAKKAKAAKDELSEENGRLKEALMHNETQKDADKNALLTMKEMLEQFTENKLQLSTQISELYQKSKLDKDTMANLRIENEAMQRQVIRLTDDNESLLQDIDRMEGQLQEVNRLSKEQKDNLELLELELNKLRETGHTQQEAINDDDDEKKSLIAIAENAQKEHRELNEKYISLKQINSEQRKKFNALKDRFVDVYRKVKKLKECKGILLETQHEYADAVTRWQNEIIHASRQLYSQMNLLTAENDELKLKLAATTTTATTTIKSNSDLDISSIALKVAAIQKLSDTAVAEYKQKCMEAIDLNEEKQRLLTTIQTQQNTLSSLEESQNALQKTHEQKEHEHAGLLSDMREINEVLKKRGDVISRQQEKQQELTIELKSMQEKLHEMEETSESDKRILLERDTQLAAVKKDLEVNRIKIDELEGVCLRREEQIRALTDEIQVMRQSGLDCQSDILSTSTISRAEEANRLREVEDDNCYEDKYNKLRGLALKMKKKLQEQTTRMEEMDRQQNTSSNSNSVGLQKDLDECRKQLATLQHEKEQNQKLIESLKADIHKMKTSRKQVNVLNLEIEAAERSLGETSTKLAARIEELHGLNEALATKENSIVQLRKEIAILEMAKTAECEHSKELKLEIDRMQAQLKDTVHGKQTALSLIKDLEQSLEMAKFELEEARLQFSRNASEHETILASTHAERTTLEQKLQHAEETLRITQASLATSERSLEDLRIEYLDYKVKAQTVLRKNQSKDTSKERELEEELFASRATEIQLKNTLQTHLAKITAIEKRNEEICEENNILQRRYKETLAIADELRQQNETLSMENHLQLRSHQEALRNYRQQIEQLDIHHKEQLLEMANNNHNQLQMKHLEKEQARMAPIVGAIATPSVPVVPPSDFLLMEREDAEGSEAEAALNSAAAIRKISSTSTTSAGMRRSHHDFLPLDELLNMPMASIVSDTVTTLYSDGHDIIKNNNDHQAVVELQATRERLQMQESRMRHLTALLAENEQDLAKLTQMNDMLKEELRRQERSEEREKHMHNSEYLKNVVVKFLTLNSADERQRLVPVLNTILKLSRSETELLNCAAKGQRVTTENRSGGGWSNFLPSWGGGGGSNVNNN